MVASPASPGSSHFYLFSFYRILLLCALCREVLADAQQRAEQAGKAARKMPGLAKMLEQLL